MGSVKVSVTYVESFTVFGSPLLCRIILERRRIFIRDRIRLGELAGWIDRSCDDVVDSPSACLSGEITVQDSFQIRIPVHLDGGSPGENSDYVRIGICQGLKELELDLRELHMLTVKTLRLAHFIETEEVENNICLFCGLNSLIFQCFIRITVPLISCRGCHDFQRGAFLRDFDEGLKFRRVYHG